MTVKPRAEFRVFGQGIIQAVQPRLWNGRTVLQQARVMPAETYLLSRRHHHANVKVRDHLLDIKIKQGETPQGYEIFAPVAKLPFPLRDAELASVAAALGITWPPLSTDDGVTEASLIAMAATHPDLAVVTVTKERWGFTIDGAICEYAKVYFNGAMVESACVECADDAIMPGVIDALGIGDRPNTSYIKAAGAVIGLDGAP